ncbi:ATP synthase subunit I [Halalkalibacter urbisdiaboli]|uniref:ATP synthase subunit I n=1 Tax=Halalkalibacter urbisdiaboli TaxID=1960589 RepID=UPI000B452E70|nr:ATP synthase subunit I [Halalkalibacter urbisdiaboli]
MTSLQGKMKQYSILVSLFAALFILGYVFTPYLAVFLGLLIGLSAGFFNLWTTYSKAKVVGSVADKIGRRSSFSFVVAGLGFVIRIGVILISLWFAVTFPDNVDLFSVITGFALIYVIIILDMLLQIVRKR